jgi:prenyltransferase beta subunit
MQRELFMEMNILASQKWQEHIGNKKVITFKFFVKVSDISFRVDVEWPEGSNTKALINVSRWTIMGWVEVIVDVTGHIPNIGTDCIIPPVTTDNKLSNTLMAPIDLAYNLTVRSVK